MKQMPLEKISLKAKVNIEGLKEDAKQISKELKYAVSCIDSVEAYDDTDWQTSEILNTLLHINIQVSNFGARLNRTRKLISKGEL